MQASRAFILPAPVLSRILVFYLLPYSPVFYTPVFYSPVFYSPVFSRILFSRILVFYSPVFSYSILPYSRILFSRIPVFYSPVFSYSTYSGRHVCRARIPRGCVRRRAAPGSRTRHAPRAGVTQAHPARRTQQQRGTQAQVKCEEHMYEEQVGGAREEQVGGAREVEFEYAEQGLSCPDARLGS
jgi:hypothetical protein